MLQNNSMELANVHGIDDIAFKKKKSILVDGGSQERQSVCYIYDMIIFPVGFSFVLSSFQYHNALQKAQMRYRLLSYYFFPNLKTCYCPYQLWLLKVSSQIKFENEACINGILIL